MSPKEVIINKATGRVSHLVLARTEQDEATGEWKIDEEETLKKVGYVIFLTFTGDKLKEYPLYIGHNCMVIFQNRDATSLYLHLAPRCLRQK